MAIYQPASYRIWLCDPRGARLTLIDNFNTLSYAKAHGAVGRATIQIPLRAINNKLLQPDYIWQIWRTPPGGLSRLVFSGMARKFRYHEQSRRNVIEVDIEDGNGLLFSRIVAYKSGASQSSKSDVIDDMMKEIVRENLGASATDTDRDLSSYDFDVQTDVSLGPTTDVAIAHTVVGDTLRKLFWDSAAQSNPVFYDLEPTLTANGQGWTFKTSTGQLGMNRTYSGGVPAVFSRNFGNLESPVLTIDHINEVTAAYVGGQGEGSFREVVEAEAAGRQSKSPWNRREVFYNGSNLHTTTELNKKAAQIRRQGRPIRRFIAKLKDTSQLRYGIDWYYGDKVVVKAYGVTFDAWLNGIAISINERHHENMDCKVEVLL